MASDSIRITEARIEGLACILVLVGILILGLRPFHRPVNAVTWLRGENGVRFGDYGMIFSSGTFQVTDSKDRASGSIEMWLQPRWTSDSNTFLSFSTPENPLQFTVNQYLSNLVVQRRIHGANQPATIGIEGIFKTIRPLFMTLTTGPQGSAIYLNGALAHSFRGYRAASTFTGQLVFGTSPVEASTWQGELYGLAIYSSQLTAKQVLDHYVNWTKQSRPEVNSEERITALYLFDERGGDVVHNAIRPGTDLYIPERYSLLHPMILQPFWEEYKPTWGYWMDILINIVGFIPLGFVCCAYFSSRVIKDPTIAVTVFGFAVSLVIELLQSYLPTRSSGTTDLLTNTIGTLVGAKFYGLRAVQALLVKMHFVSRGQK